MHVLVIAKGLTSVLGSAAWIFAGVIGAFTVFVGAALAVALIDNGERGRRAQKILTDLLALFSRGGQ
jgi:hypothetical protein